MYIENKNLIKPIDFVALFIFSTSIDFNLDLLQYWWLTGLIYRRQQKRAFSFNLANRITHKFVNEIFSFFSMTYYELWERLTTTVTTKVAAAGDICVYIHFIYVDNHIICKRVNFFLWKWTKIGCERNIYIILMMTWKIIFFFFTEKQKKKQKRKNSVVFHEKLHLIVVVVVVVVVFFLFMALSAADEI